jgi:hypothetical protein
MTDKKMAGTSPAMTGKQEGGVQAIVEYTVALSYDMQEMDHVAHFTLP